MSGKKPTKIQLYIHDKLRSLGFDVFVIDNLESRDRAVSFFLKNAKESNTVMGKPLSL